MNRKKEKQHTESGKTEKTKGKLIFDGKNCLHGSGREKFVCHRNEGTSYDRKR